MRKRANVLLSTVVASAIYAIPTVSNAQAVVLEEISVTATKTERKISDVPASVEIITEKDIKKTPANTVVELLRYTSGLDVGNGESIITNENRVKMRGFGGSSNGRVLVLVDGVALNDAMSQSVQWNKIAIEDIEKIEIVKGANSALYGSNAMGGVINIITKKPKEQKTNVSLTYGSMNTKIGSVGTTGKIDKLGYYLSAARAVSDGYVKELPANIKDTTLKTGIKRDNLLAKVTYQIDDDSDVYFTVVHFENKQTDEKDILDYDGYHQKETSIKSGYKTKIFNDAEFSVNLYKVDEDKSYDLASTTAVTSTTVTNLKRFGGNIQVTIPIQDTHFITTGIETRYDELDNNSDYTTGKAIQNLGSQDYYAIFLQDEIFLGEKTIINIGGRYDSYDNHKGNQYQSDRTPDTTNYESKTFSAFSPKIGALYNISNNLSFRASIGKAFRAPSLYELYSTLYASKIYYSNPDLKPEKVLSYEAGFDYKFYNKAKWSVTGYQSDAEDFIYSTTRADGNKDKTNVGEVEIKGIETELFMPINDNLDFMANYTYNISKIKKFAADSTLEGKYLTLIPKHKANAAITYANPNIVNITAGVRYVGDRYNDDANTESKAYQSYTLYDLKLSRKITDNSKLTLTVDDLFDKGYAESLVSSGRVIMATYQMSF